MFIDSSTIPSFKSLAISGIAIGLATIAGCAGSSVEDAGSSVQYVWSSVEDQAAIDAVIRSAPRAPLEELDPEGRLLFIVGPDEKKGLIDTQGRIVVEPQFVWALSSTEGRAKVTRHGLSGFVDGTGRIVIELTWDDASSFSEGLAVVATGIEKWFEQNIGLTVQRGGERGYIDRDGNIVIAAQFDDARPFSEGVAWVLDGKKWGLIDRTGKYLIEPRFQFEPAWDFSEGLCPVWQGNWSLDESVGRFGYIDTTGKMVIPAQFRGAGAFSEGMAPIVKGSKLGFIDRAGEISIEPQFEWGSMSPQTRLPIFADGLAAVSVRGRLGFINKAGQITIEPRFEVWGMQVTGFSEGLAAVQLGGKTGFIDKEGRMVIEPRFTRVDPFEDGIARVEVKLGHWGYIRRDGVFVWNPLAVDKQ